jgi:anti-anti-sigma factor
MRTLEMTARPGAQPGQTVFVLVGALELQQVFGFQAKMREDESQVTILDMSAVTYVDSAGIGALVNANISRQRRGRKFAIAGITDRAKIVLDVTGTSQFFDFYPTAAEAEDKVPPTSAASI